MTTAALILLTALATLALSAYGVYLARLVSTDGSLLRREPPPSHEPDLFEARVGKFDLLDPATGSMRTA